MAGGTNWFADLGAWAGLIGGAAGVIGAVVSLVAWNDSKRLALVAARLVLRKDVVTLTASLDHLRQQIDAAYLSRRAIVYGTGSAMQLLEDDVGKAKEECDRIRLRIPPAAETFEDLDQAGLAGRAVEIHRLQDSVTRMAAKYTAMLSEDEQRRVEKRQDADARARAWSSTTPRGH